MNNELSTTLVKFVNHLADGQCYSGVDIAQHLGISRAAVSKMAKQLREYDFPIDSAKRGYRLRHSLTLLDKEQITAHPPGDITVEVLEKVHSTNDYLKANPHSPTICLAEHQRQGRGRRDRQWLSPFGRNIYCSLRHNFTQDFSKLSGLGLVVSVIIAQTLEAFHEDLRPQLKWPNDLYIQGQKVGGVLIDILGEAHGECTAIIGFGLNVNMVGQTLSGLDNWTSLDGLLGDTVDRNILVVSLIQNLSKGLALFAKEGLHPFLPLWKQRDMLEGQRIALINGPSATITGTARGVTAEGHLRLETSQGLQTFASGDTHLQSY